MSRRLTIEQVVASFKATHGDRYDYSLITEYKSNSQKLPIVCPKHGLFYQSQWVHQSGHGCPECAKTKSDNVRRVEECRRTFEQKARAIHGDKYDYSRVKYVNNSTPVEIICPEHGPFMQIPSSHLDKKRNVGCPICGKARNQLSCLRKMQEASESFEQKARKVHGDKYDYSKVEYRGATKEVTIICPVHGEFRQVATYHLNGCGCQKCHSLTSKFENEVLAYVKEIMPERAVFQSQKGLFVGESKGREVDIWIPSLKIGIECDGLYWHGEEQMGISGKHGTIVAKQDGSLKSGFRLINIFEDEWELRKDIAKSRLRSVLGVGGQETIYARKCEIRQITNAEAKAFLDKNHLQGGNPYCHFAGGLFYKGELVSVMIFCKPRVGFGNGKQTEGVYELTKFASRIGCNVIGGASRLLKFFIKNTGDCKEIYSFADRRWSDGNLYERLGFAKVSVTLPNYFYIVNHKRQNRFGYRKSELIKQGFDATKTESEIMAERGIDKVYDAGTFKYVLSL